MYLSNDYDCSPVNPEIYIVAKFVCSAAVSDIAKGSQQQWMEMFQQRSSSEWKISVQNRL